MPPKTRGSKKAASDAAAASATVGTLRTISASRKAMSTNVEANIPSADERADAVLVRIKNKRGGKSSRGPSGDELGGLSQQYSQLSQNRDPNWVLLFVLPTGLTEATCDPNLSALYLMCCDMDLTCKWISEEDTLHHEPQYGNIFVLSPFEGRAFDQLFRLWEKNKNFEIVGPQCLKYSLQSKEECRIQSKQVPAFTLGMRNMLVTLTGVPQEQKESLVKKIQLMNGCVSNVFTQAVTHVVAGVVTSEKCLRAYENEIPVMTCKWVEEVWKDSQIELIHATDSKYVKFACPVFHNLVICISQVSNRIKTKIGEIINQNGGKYSAELKRQDTNVLVVPGDEGSKFTYAHQWKIPCVTPEWIEASKSAGHVVSFDLFKVEPNKIVISTPKNSQIAKNGNLNSSSSSISYVAGAGSLVVETFCSTEGKPSCVDVVHSKNEETFEILRKAAEHGPYLDGCTVYVCGWKTSVSETLKKMINASGATRLNRLNVKVTHVLVIDRLSEDDADALRNLEHRPYVVSFDWMIQSAKQNSPADEEAFPYELKSQSRISDTRCQSEASSVSAGSSIRDLVENISKSKSNELGNEDIVVLASDAASPVLDQNTENSNTVEHCSDAPNISPVVCEPEKNLQVENLTPLAKKTRGNTYKTSTPSDAIDAPHESSQEEDTQFSSLNPLDTNSSNVFPFTGMKFKVMLNSEEESKEVKQLIQGANGKVVSVSGHSDIVILPVVFSPQLVVDPLAKRLTKFWVMDVINNESLDVGELFYYKPLPEYAGMNAILVDVVVGTSNYSNNEKEYISTVVRAMGGAYQDIFARKPSKQHETLRSTHLICPITDNEKYRAAKKWGTPVAIFDWILDSHAKKRKVDIASYNPEFAKSDTDFTVSYMPRTPKHIEGSRAKHNKLDKYSGLSNIPSSTSKFKPVRLQNDKDEVLFTKPTNPPRDMGSGKKPAARSTPARAAATNRVLPPGLAEDDPLCQSESFLECYHTVYKPMVDAMTAPDLLNEAAKTESFIEYFETIYKPMLEAQKTPDKEDSYIVEGFTRSESRHIKKCFREVGNNSPAMRVMRARTPPITPLSEWMAKRMKEKLDKNPVCEDSFWGRSPPRGSTSRMSTSSESVGPAANRSLKRSSDSSLEEDASSLVNKKLRLSYEDESDGDGKGSTSMEQGSLSNSSRGNPTEAVEDEIMEVAPDVDDAAKELLLKKETIFQNVKVWIAKDCKDYEGLSGSVKLLGGNVVENTAGVIVTHIIVESDRTEAVKIAALFPKAKLVSPQWIQDCKAKKTRINEYDYKPVASSKQSMQFLCHLLAEDNNAQTREESLKPESSKQKRSSPRITKNPSLNDLQIQPHEVDAPDVIWDDEENKNVNIQHQRPGTSRTDAVVNGVEKQSREQGRSRHVSAEPGLTVQPQSTKKTTPSKIPTTAEARKNIPSKIPTSAEAKRVGRVIATNNGDFMIPVPKGSIFMMSGGQDGWKKEATDIVTALGGSMTPKASFDSDALALVAASLARSEKVLGCVASGKSLLKMSYLLDSSKAKQFLPITEKYMWQAADGKEALDTQIAKFGYEWFCRHRENPEDRPMKNMTFYVHEPNAGRKQSYSTLIRIGGGSVVGNPNEAEIILATTPQLPANMKVNPKIPIKHPLYLNELLIGVVVS